MRSESGQASVEWVGLTLIVSLALGALALVGPQLDGRAFGTFLAHSIVCAMRGGCGGERALRTAYGVGQAGLVRAYAPNVVYEPGTLTLPVDPRECRAHRCSDAPDDPDLDAHRPARGGGRATAFTHVRRLGGETFIQYWLYYPDSTTTALNAAGAWNTAARAVRPLARRLGAEPPAYPGFHLDDWESYQVRIDARGQARVRASSHHWYQGCKQRRCRNRWTDWTGWTRVSRGSHAGHIPLDSELVAVELGHRASFVRARWRHRPLYPGRDIHERTTTAPGLNLVPLEPLGSDWYEALDPSIVPPWWKDVYLDPLSDSTS